MLTNFCGTNAASLTTITNGCLRIGEVRKLIFQRKYSTGSTLNEFTIASANPNVIASWTPLLTASDGTKAVVTPFEVHAPNFAPGTIIEEGGVGETAGGVPEFAGFNPTTFTCRVRAATAQSILDLRQNYGEVLTVSYINAFGKIIMTTDDNGSPTVARGFDIKSFSVGQRQNMGLQTVDYNEIRFYMEDGWDNYIYEVDPQDFKALTGLAN